MRLIDGLVPLASYNVYAYLWVDDLPPSNWRLKASLTQMPPLPDNPTVSYSFKPTVSTTVAPPAAAGDFLSPPLMFDGNRTLLQASLGQTHADILGHIPVGIDDYFAADATTSNRSWYDGVGYALAVPEPASLAPAAIALLAVLRRRRPAP